MIRRVVNRLIEMFIKHKWIPVLVWGLILGLHTWTDNLGNLIRYQTIAFKWIDAPDYWSFFNLKDITQIHHDFIIVKTGHFMGFAIFDFLVFHWLKSHKQAFAASFTFALTTEVLQLFFGRDGRLYDVTIDFLGALSVSYVYKSGLIEKIKPILKPGR